MKIYVAVINVVYPFWNATRTEDAECFLCEDKAYEYIEKKRRKFDKKKVKIEGEENKDNRHYEPKRMKTEVFVCKL